MVRACAACHRFLPQRSCKSSCSLVLSAARRSLVLVSLGCVCGWVSWPSGHFARATLWGLLGVGTSFGHGCVLASLVGEGSRAHRVRRSLALRTFVVVGLLRSFSRGALRRLLSSGGGGARVRGLCLSRRCLMLPRRRSFLSAWAGAHAQRPPSRVCFRWGRRSWVASRGKPRGCLRGGDMRTRAAVVPWWPLGHRGT